MAWSKDSAESRLLGEVQKACKPIIPASLRKSTTQVFPNRGTHLGVLIEWAVANGYTITVSKPDRFRQHTCPRCGMLGDVKDGVLWCNSCGEKFRL